MKNPFEIIAYWLSRQSMTTDEKRTLRQTLVAYAQQHPVTPHFLSPFVMRFAGIAFASLVLVFGIGAGITSASMRSLPNQSLYPIKLWIEEVQSNTQKTPEGKIAFETKRIERRFDETTRLASSQSLNEETASIIRSGIEYSESKIKSLATSLETTQPALALEATNKLESTLATSGKLLARIEQTTGQNVRPIVLAAQASTDKIALEKISLERLVALQPNELTQETVLVRFSELEATSTEATAPLLSEIKEKIDAGAYSEALVIIKKIDQIIQEKERTQELEEAYDALGISGEAFTSGEPSQVIPDETPEVNEENLLENPKEIKMQPTQERLPVSEHTGINQTETV